MGALTDAIVSEKFDDITIEDTINKNYLNFDYFYINYISNGELTYRVENGDLFLTWKINGELISGSNTRLNIGINPNLDYEKIIVPVTTHSKISYQVLGESREKEYTNTPEVKFVNILYIKTCSRDTSNIFTKITEEHIIGDIIDLSNVVLECENCEASCWEVYISDYDDYSYCTQAFCNYRLD